MTNPNPPANQPLRSVHTHNFPQILGQFGISLAISTYQAGHLIIVRNDGGNLNTHFRRFNRPMGMATAPGRLALGTGREVWTYRNVPDVAKKLEPPGKYDACYIPRDIHVTGDIDIHEMAWDAEGELWLVNTKFSCLCTLDHTHNFIPRWRPPFVSALYLEDRCHLNGLAMRNGQPKYVTMLGETDSPGGWRKNKKDGGLLIDIDSNTILVRGLSMPHSPRWYDGKLWLLESGYGSLAWVDLKSGKVNTVAKLPGFTRGLDFYGPLAFVGLSQVRESATFSGIPITEQLTERISGVWVVNIKTGEMAAFLRFEEAVQEIFAVEILHARFPELLEWADDKVAHSYVLPDEALVDVKPHPETVEAHKKKAAEKKDKRGGNRK